MNEIQRCEGCSLPVAAGRHAEDCPKVWKGETIDFERSKVVEFLSSFGGLGKVVWHVMQMFGIERKERDEVRAKVDAAVASGDPCFIAFEMGTYRYRVRIG